MFSTLLSRKNRPSASPQTQRRGLEVECLERRDLMTASPFTLLSNGWLFHNTSSGSVLIDTGVTSYQYASSRPCPNASP
jgi:hypothetical protein